jgi:hypothetical protein
MTVGAVRKHGTKPTNDKQSLLLRLFNTRPGSADGTGGFSMSHRMWCSLVYLALSVACFAFLGITLSNLGESGDTLGAAGTLLCICLVGGAVFFASLSVAFVPYAAFGHFCESAVARIGAVIGRFSSRFYSRFVGWDATMDQVADKVQDAIMGWDLDNEPTQPSSHKALPPLDTLVFARAMRREVLQLLHAVVREINEAPNGVSIAARGPAIYKLLDAWTQKALELGEQIRVDGAVADLPQPKARHTEWTQKLRRMSAGAGELLPTADD